MKTRWGVIVLIGLLAVVCADAQVEDRQISLGFKGGITVPNMTSDPDTGRESDSLMGFGLGAVLGFSLSTKISIDTDFLYVQRGASFRRGTPPGCPPAESDTRLTYMAISPLLRFRVLEEGLSPYLMAGPELGFLMSARNEGNWECEGQAEGWEDDVKDYYKDVDFGLAFGAGLEFPSSGGAFFLEGRYYLGLTEIDEPGVDEAGIGSDCELDCGGESVKNRTVCILGGIRFQ